MNIRLLSKRLYLTFFVAATALMPWSAVQAAEVDATTAERVARTFWNAHRDKDVAPLTDVMVALDLKWDAFHVFSPAEGDGFVIVAADDRVRPILAYSFSNRFMRDSVGAETAWWLDGWQSQVDHLRAEGLKATDDVTARWRRLLDGTEPVHPSKAIGPLMTTQWDQDVPYNDSCPSKTTYWGSVRKAYTGCVATAMAQIMRYWEWPVRGTGSNTYTAMDPNNPFMSGFGLQTVDFNATTYDWANMPDMLNSISSNEEKSAVATLMYHCGVACNMMYGSATDGGSGAMVQNVVPLMSSMHNGMIKYLGYSSKSVGISRKYYDDSTWNAIIKTEMIERRPVLFGGGDEESGGHSFVCNGLDDDGLFYFNWGWSGDGDGYFTLDNLAPGVGGAGGGTGTYNFTNDQEAIIGIKPHSDGDSLCIIREFPYVMDFETSPACWDIGVSSNYSTSWMLDEVAANEGHYAMLSTAPYGSAAHDTLITPALLGPGRFVVSWLDMAKTRSVLENYRVVAAGDTLYRGTTSSNWGAHSDTLELVEGDTVRVMFIWDPEPSANGFYIDNFTVDRIDNTASIATAGQSALQTTVYPNPASGDVTVRLGQPATVAVMDLAGRTVYTTGSEATVHSIPRAKLQQGVYIVRAVGNGTTSAVRLVVM